MSCSYATLNSYNSKPCGTMAVASAEATTGYYVVPSYTAPGYDALTHGDKKSKCEGSAPGFFNIDQAYGQSAGACNQKYHKSHCNQSPLGPGPLGPL